MNLRAVAFAALGLGIGVGMVFSAVVMDNRLLALGTAIMVLLGGLLLIAYAFR
jgi:hypothetical protein